MRPPRPFRRRLLVALSVLALGFTWGFFTHHARIFPHALLVDLAVLAGAIDPPKTFVEPRLARLAALAALPYLDGTGDEDRSVVGVVHHERQRAHAGLNLTGRRGRAELFDMEGRVVHHWQGSDPWMPTELLPDGALLALAKDVGLWCLEPDSEVRWSFRARVHHATAVDADGHVHVLTRHEEFRPDLHPKVPVVVDTITTLSPDGEVLGKLSLLDVILRSPHAYLLGSVAHAKLPPNTPALDLLHANHLQVLDGSLEDRLALFARGNILVSLRNVNAIALLGRDGHDVLWLWGPNNLHLQHHPTLLRSGRVLLFDNGEDHSRVLELDSSTRRVHWAYGPVDGFHSRLRGACQRLPNGNTLVTESDAGRAFEVDPGGAIVWAWSNPRFTPAGDWEIVPRVTRVPASVLEMLTADG